MVRWVSTQESMQVLFRVVARVYLRLDVPRRLREAAVQWKDLWIRESSRENLRVLDLVPSPSLPKLCGSGQGGNFSGPSFIAPLSSFSFLSTDHHPYLDCCYILMTMPLSLASFLWASSIEIPPSQPFSNSGFEGHHSHSASAESCLLPLGQI